MSPESPSARSYVSQRLQQLTDFVNNPFAEETLAKGEVRPARALVLRAVMATPGLPEFLYSQFYTRRYQKVGHHVLGVGYHAVTVADGPDTVRKFYRRTAGLSEEAQGHYIEAMHAKQASTLTHLAEYAVPQSFAIEESPLEPGRSIVTARQKRVAIERGVNLYDSTTTAAVDIAPFVRDTRAMREQSTPEALPDIVGVNNIVVEATTGSLLLVDPVSLHADDPTDAAAYAHAMRILDRI